MANSRINSRQLVIDTLQGLPTPRVPVCPLAVHFCAGIKGCTVRQYTTDPGALADSVIAYARRFNPDAVWISSDTWVSAEAMGAVVGATDDNQPFGGVGPPLIQTYADVTMIPDPDISCQGRYPVMIEALKRVRAALGNDVFIVACFDQYPFSLASALLGINHFMVKLLDEPALVRSVMDRCLEFGFAYGLALCDAGADMLSGGDSPAGLVGPQLYRDMALPYEKLLISRLQAATRKPVSLHICGNTLPILSDMAQAGADSLELDHHVDLATACSKVGQATALWGNLDPVGVLAHGTPEQVRKACSEAVAAVRKNGRLRFVLSSGCTLAPGTPEENVRALFDWNAEGDSGSPTAMA